jgi:hypothetical protein
VLISFRGPTLSAEAAQVCTNNISNLAASVYRGKLTLARLELARLEKAAKVIEQLYGLVSSSGQINNAAYILEMAGKLGVKPDDLAITSDQSTLSNTTVPVQNPISGIESTSSVNLLMQTAANAPEPMPVSMHNTASLLAQPPSYYSGTMPMNMMPPAHFNNGIASSYPYMTDYGSSEFMQGSSNNPMDTSGFVYDNTYANPYLRMGGNTWQS